MFNLLYFGISNQEAIDRYSGFDTTTISNFGRTMRLSIGAITNVGFIVFIIILCVFVAVRLITFFYDRR